MEKSDGKASVTVSPKAAAHIATIMATEGLTTHGLRIGVKKSGCTGYEYTFQFAAAPADDDYIYQTGELRIYIDRTSLEKLDGAVLDYTDGLVGAGLAFRNPQATRTCGCGASFSTE
jgi:iron-sulfur cluster assembly protein